MLDIRNTTIEDVSVLATKLREDDKREVEAAGYTPVASLFTGFKTSYLCKSVFQNGEIIGIYGATTRDLPNGYCSIWFLGSDESERNPLTFVKEGKKLIKEVLKDYSILNFVYSKNTTHINYLKRIGLIVETEKGVTYPTGEVFYPFYKLKEV